MSNQLSWRCVSIGLALVGARPLRSSEGLAPGPDGPAGRHGDGGQPRQAASRRLPAAAQGPGAGRSQPQLPTTPLIIDDVFVPLTRGAGTRDRRHAGRQPRRLPAVPARHRRLDVRAGRQPARHPRPRQLPRARPGERHRLARRVGAERGPRRPHRSLRRRPDRGGARAGDAALRLAGHRRRGERQQRPHPRVHPAARLHRRRPRAASARSTTAPTAPSRSRPAPATSPCTPTPSSATPATTTRPQGRMPNSFVDNEGFSVGTSYVGSDGFIGVSFTRYDSLYGIPARAQDVAHRHEAGQGAVARRMARARRRHRGDPLLVRRLRLRSTTRSTNATGDDRLALHSTRSTRAASRCSTCPSRPRFGELRGAVGTQFGHRKYDGLELRGRRSLLEPAHDQQRRRLLVRGAAGDASGCACRRPRASSRRRSTASASTSPTQLAAALIAAERTFTPFSASAGILYELPHGRRRAPDRRSTWSARRPTPSCSPRACTRRPRRSRSAIRSSTKEKAQHLRARLQEGQRARSASMRRPTTPSSTASSSSSGPARPATTTLDLRTRGGAGGELDQIVFQQRDAHFYGVELRRPARHRPRLARHVGHRRPVRLRARHASTMRRAATCRASRRIAPAPASTIATPTGSRASASCTPSTRTRSATTRRRPRATRC